MHLDGASIQRVAALTVSVHGEQFITELLSYGCAVLTATTYRYILRYFSDWLRVNGGRLEDVTKQTLLMWMTDLRLKGNRLKTTKLRVTVVKHFFAWLHENRYIPENPLLYLKSVKAPERVPRPLALSFIEKLVEAARNSEGRMIYPKRDVALLWILYEAGARRAEGLDLDMADVDLEKWTVILKGKGGTEDYQPITERSVRALRAWFKQREELIVHWGRPHEKAVFVTWRGRMRRTQLQQMLDRLTKAAGLPHCHPHQFRHSLASHSLESGMDFKYVKDLIRHKSTSSTDRYTHVSKEKLRFEYMKAMGFRPPNP